MTNIEGISLERVKQDLLNGRRDSISTKTFEAIIDLLEDKIKECEIFRKGNDEKNELLEKLGCPTKGTARRLALTLQEQEETVNKYEEFLRWMLKQQYYIIHPNLKKKIKALLESEDE